jgi:hypothetical protein
MGSMIEWRWAHPSRDKSTLCLNPIKRNCEMQRDISLGQIIASYGITRTDELVRSAAVVHSAIEERPLGGTT